MARTNRFTFASSHAQSSPGVDPEDDAHTTGSAGSCNDKSLPTVSQVTDPKAYVCRHVFLGARPVLYLYRDEDGDQILACGGEDHEQSADDWKVVHLAHELEKDVSVTLMLDLAKGERAERRSVVDSWVRTVEDG